MLRRILATSICLLFAFSALPMVSGEEADGLIITETVIGDFALTNPVMVEGKQSKSYYISPDMSRIAFIIAENDGKSLMVDGKKGKIYDEITDVKFSPDSKQIAYTASLDHKWFVVVNRKPGKMYDNVTQGSLLFSPNSKRLAYIASSGDGEFVVIKGKECRKFQKVRELLFSANGKTFAYVAKDMEGSTIPVVEGKQIRKCENTFSILLSSNGKQYAVEGFGTLHINGKMVVNADMIYGDEILFAEKGKTWGAIADFHKTRYDDDGKELTAAGKELFCVINGKKYGPYKERCAGLELSPNGKRFAYYASDTEQSKSIYIDGKKGKQIDGDDFPYFLFSPDSKRLAYEVGGKVFEDGREIKEASASAAWDFVYSPKSELAFIGSDGEKRFLVLDGKRQEEITAFTTSHLTFSKSGNSYAFYASSLEINEDEIPDEEDEEEEEEEPEIPEIDLNDFIVFNGKCTPNYERVFSGQVCVPRFRAEGIAWTDMLSELNNLINELCGDDAITIINGIWYTPQKIAFVNDKKIRFVVKKGDKIVRVEVSIK